MTTLRVGVVGYSAQAFDHAQALRFIKEAYDRVSAKNPEVAIVSGLTNIGIPAIAYAEAKRRGWWTVGVACEEVDEEVEVIADAGEDVNADEGEPKKVKKVKKYECFLVDERIIEGKIWGDESPTFIANIHALIRVGGGNQAHAETREAKNQGKWVIEYELPVV